LNFSLKDESINIKIGAIVDRNSTILELFSFVFFGQFSLSSLNFQELKREKNEV